MPLDAVGKSVPERRWIAETAIAKRDGVPLCASPNAAQGKIPERSSKIPGFVKRAVDNFGFIWPSGRLGTIDSPKEASRLLGRNLDRHRHVTAPPGSETREELKRSAVS